MTRDELFVLVMHRLADAFAEHAILKGGLVLRLLESPRLTNDLDYVFVPYDSKTKARKEIEAALAAIAGVRITAEVSSRMVRFLVHASEADIQVEVHVADACESTSLPTAQLARAAGQPSRIVRVMRYDVALAHKLAAWNERRLPRDLYDVYFFVSRLNERPHMTTLDQRLSRIESRLPALKKHKRMTRAELAAAVQMAADVLTQSEVETSLSAILPPVELAGLAGRMKVALSKVADLLVQS